MPFLTQGKTNWKFIGIVVILAVIVGGGILGWIKTQEAPSTELTETEKPEKMDINKYLHKDAILEEGITPTMRGAGYAGISVKEAAVYAIQHLKDRDVENIEICETYWIAAPLSGYLVDGKGSFSIEDKHYLTFRIGIRDGAEGMTGDDFVFIARGEDEEGNIIWYPEPGPDFYHVEDEVFPEELLVYEFLDDRDNFEALSFRFIDTEDEITDSKKCIIDDDCIAFGEDGDYRNCGCFNKDYDWKAIKGNSFCYLPLSCKCVDGRCEEEKKNAITADFSCDDVDEETGWSICRGEDYKFEFMKPQDFHWIESIAVIPDCNYVDFREDCSRAETGSLILQLEGSFSNPYWGDLSRITFSETTFCVYTSCDCGAGSCGCYFYHTTIKDNNYYIISSHYWRGNCSTAFGPPEGLGLPVSEEYKECVEAQKKNDETFERVISTFKFID